MKFTDILEQFNIPYKTAGEHRHTTPGWISVECPLCSPNSGKFKLGFNIAHLYMSCWTCGAVRAADALATITGQPASVCWHLFRSIPHESVKNLSDRRGKLVLPKGVGPLLPAHRKYLQGRGFDPDELERVWGVKGIGHAAELAWRVFIPVVHHGETVSWTARAIGNSGRRYMNARPEQEAIGQKQVLFGADFVRHAVIVCEGSFDAMRIGPGAVAVMGLITTAAQQLAISKYPKRILCFDNEPEAQKRAIGVMRSVMGFPGETINFVLDAKDAGEADMKEIRQLRKLLK